ncbi:hypothetical protein M9H77_04981 [Catharanthus roseus]|uniref:Uncharacterized protein n=1 Tax=Catharanthus roseus TaxID=4058 RepID=A0ACC0CFK9_CATRO|nr:hypothetical protein M9H77_04981 [Catharanthus roseus]
MGNGAATAGAGEAGSTAGAGEAGSCGWDWKASSLLETCRSSVGAFELEPPIKHRVATAGAGEAGSCCWDRRITKNTITAKEEVAEKGKRERKREKGCSTKLVVSNSCEGQYISSYGQEIGLEGKGKCVNNWLEGLLKSSSKQHNSHSRFSSSQATQAVVNQEVRLTVAATEELKKNRTTTKEEEVAEKEKREKKREKRCSKELVVSNRTLHQGNTILTLGSLRHKPPKHVVNQELRLAAAAIQEFKKNRTSTEEEKVAEKEKREGKREKGCSKELVVSNW